MIQKETVLKFLQSNKVATLATVSSDCMPQADTVYYYLEDDFTIYFPTKKLSQKFKNIEFKNDIFLVVTNVEKKRTVSIKGQAFKMKNVSSLNIIQKVAGLLNGGDKFDTVFPILQRNDGDLVVVKIQPKSIRYTEYTESGFKEQTFTL